MMIYLDYSATTPVDQDVLDVFCECTKKNIGNANSLHLLGNKCDEQINEDSKSILKDLGLNDDYKVIYTSGASEANNLAIKGLLEASPQGKHIITTEFEHPSVIAPLGYLQKKGYFIDFVKTDKNGVVDLVDLEKLITKDTVLVTIVSVNSEIGIKQPINKISKIVREYPHVLFHTDITQSIGKIIEDLSDIDMMSFSCHKFYGIKGVGALIKKKNIKLTPQIHGGTSTTKYRSGTPFHPLIHSMAYALSKAVHDYSNRIIQVEKVHSYLCEQLANIPTIKVNSNIYAIPHIVNISVLGKNSIEIVKYLSEKEIYISNHTACSSKQQMSLAVYNLTKNKELALSSVRISLSHLTTISEIDFLVKSLKELVD